MLNEQTCGKTEERAAICPALLTADPSAAVPAAQIGAAYAERIGGGVVLLEAKKDGQRKGFGSGFVISKEGHLLTCAHVVDGADEIRARLYRPGLPGGEARWYDCAILQPVRKDPDLAMLRIKDGGGFTPLNLRGPGEPVEAAEEVLIVGYPFGDAPDLNMPKSICLFEGLVCGVQSAGTTRERAYIDCAGKAGCSGGPVVSRRDSRVVGVFDGSLLAQEDGRLTEEMNRFIPLRLFWENFVEEFEGGDPIG